MKKKHFRSGSAIPWPVLLLVCIGLCLLAATTWAQGPPVQRAPASGATQQPVNVLLDWNAVSGASGYDWELYQGTNLIDSGGPIAATAVRVDAGYGTTYRWRVRARVLPQNNPWSGYWTFSTVALVPPVHSSPANGATGLPLSVTLDWQGVSGASGYDWELYQGGNLVAENGPITDTFVTRTLSPNTNYTWRVRARVAVQQNPWSSPWAFKTAALVPPVHVSPLDGTTQLPLTVTLNWRAISGAAAYDWEIYQGGNLVAHNNYIGDTFVTQTLNPNTNYTWRVRARVAVQENPWSNPWAFKTAPLVPPVHVSPPNGANLTPLTVTLDWQPVADAEFYYWEISRAGSVVAQGATLATQITQTLNGNRTYTWRVRAKVVEQENPWSEPWQFKNGVAIREVTTNHKKYTVDPDGPGVQPLRIFISEPVPSGSPITPTPEPGVIGYRISDFGTLIPNSTDYTFNDITGELRVFKPGNYRIEITPKLVSETNEVREDTPVIYEFTIAKILPVLSWSKIVDVEYGRPLWTTGQGPEANVAGTFTFEPEPDTVLDAGDYQYELWARFVPEDSNQVEERSVMVRLKVRPAPLTVSAGQLVRRQGSNLSGLPVTYAGFRNGDGPGDLDEEPYIAGPPASALPGIDYPLQVVGGSDPNYTLTRVNGTLTILPLPDKTPLVMERMAGASASWLLRWEELQGWQLMDSPDCRQWSPVEGVSAEGTQRRFLVVPPAPGGARSRFFSLRPIP